MDIKLSSTSIKWLRLAVVVFVLTVLLLLGVWWVRWEETAPPLSNIAWETLVIDSETLGLALQELFVLLMALYLLSSTAIFERIVTTRQHNKVDYLKLTITLILIQSLAFIFNGWLNQVGEGLITNGTLMVAVAALLGGWRVGATVGFVTQLLYGSYFIYSILPLVQDEPLVNVLLWGYILNFEAVGALYGGIVVGLWRDEWPEQVWQLHTVFMIGVLLEWFPAWVDVLVRSDLGDVQGHLPASLITGFVLLIFALLVRQTQGRMAQRRVDSAEHARIQAELKALRAQINPHFLFNALSTIRYHVRTNPQTAYDLLDDLSDIFHSAFKAEAFVPLADELDTVKAYLALEQARLRDRLSVLWEIDDTIDLYKPVPTLIVQPLVENAVVHGIATQPQGGTITIIVSADDTAYQITVADTGPGFNTNTPQIKGSGIGLANVHKRLFSLYGPDYAPVIKSALATGTHITIRIPL